MTRAAMIAIVVMGLAVKAAGIFFVLPSETRGFAAKGYPNWILGLGIPVAAAAIFFNKREISKQEVSALMR